MSDSYMRWDVPKMETARWVKAKLFGSEMTAFLQNETVMGYWVQFDPDGQFRLVEKIEEIKNV